MNRPKVCFFLRKNGSSNFAIAKGASAIQAKIVYLGSFPPHRSVNNRARVGELPIYAIFSLNGPYSQVMR